MAIRRRFSSIWAAASSVDSTLTFRGRDIPWLRKMVIEPETYSRERLFGCLSQRRPVIFDDFCIRLLNRDSTRYEGDFFSMLTRALPAKRRVEARIGALQEAKSVPIGNLLRKWRRGSRVTVTDLHFRGTRLERLIDLSPLSDFNLLLLGSEQLALQEMMTLVISSAGAFTDSHSDDPDGSNHCFVGEKLWLAWDTFEGAAAGLEDTSRDDVEDRAAFDMATFLSLRSSCWFVVSDGDTLFLPGALTHKVITLRPYIGLGSFFVSLAGGVENLCRWYEHQPLWERSSPANAGLLDEIAMVMRRKAKSLQYAGVEVKRHWGYRNFETSAMKLFSDKRRKPFCRRGRTKLRGLIDVARKPSPTGR